MGHSFDSTHMKIPKEVGSLNEQKVGGAYSLTCLFRECRGKRSQ